VYFTTDYSHFEIVYDFNPLDFFSLSIAEKISFDGNEKTQVV